MNCIVNRQYLQANNKAVVYLALDITPPAVTAVPQAMKPINVCITIDRSGSMDEERKLENAKIAALQLIEELRPNDYATVVSFADSERVEVAAQSAADKYYFQQAIQSMKAKGMTDIYSAVQASLNEIMRARQQFAEEPVSRIILLSDGEPTKGRQKVDEFLDVCNEIRSRDVSITALGIGSDYNEQLMATLANQTNGTWNHVTDPRDLPSLFSEQLVEMKTVVLLKPQLRIQPMSGAELSEMHKVRPVLDLVKDPKVIDGKYIISLNDLVAGQQQNVVARFHLPPRKAGNYRIAHVEMVSGRTVLSEDVVVTYTDDASLYGKETSSYPRVLLMTSEGTVLLRDGIRLNDETIIKQAETIVRKTLEDPNAQTLVRTNEAIGQMVTVFKGAHEETVIKKGKLSEEDKKRLQSETTVIKKRQQNA
jgi:Ca-activated chloride channel family protein